MANYRNMGGRRQSYGGQGDHGRMGHPMGIDPWENGSPLGGGAGLLPNPTGGSQDNATLLSQLALTLPEAQLAIANNLLSNLLQQPQNQQSLLRLAALNQLRGGTVGGIGGGMGGGSSDMGQDGGPLGRGLLGDGPAYKRQRLMPEYGEYSQQHQQQQPYFQHHNQNRGFRGQGGPGSMQGAHFRGRGGGVAGGKRNAGNSNSGNMQKRGQGQGYPFVPPLMPRGQGYNNNSPRRLGTVGPRGQSRGQQRKSTSPSRGPQQRDSKDKAHEGNVPGSSIAGKPREGKEPVITKIDDTEDAEVKVEEKPKAAAAVDEVKHKPEEDGAQDASKEKMDSSVTSEKEDLDKKSSPEKTKDSPEKAKDSSPVGKVVAAAVGKQERTSNYAGLPKSLLTCHICKKTMWDGLSFENHLKGRAHMLMMGRMQENYDIKVEVQRQEMKMQEDQRIIELQRLHRMGKRVPNLERREFCMMCNLSVIGPVLEHRKTPRHQKLKHFLHPVCETCNKEFSTRISWDRHRLSLAHLRKVAAKESDGEKNQPDGAPKEEEEEDEEEEEEEEATEEEKVQEFAVTQKEFSSPKKTEQESSQQKLNEREKPIPAKSGDGVSSPLTNVYGQSAVMKVEGYVCRACRRFFRNEHDAMVTHCRLPSHHERFRIFQQNKEQMKEAKKDLKGCKAEDEPSVNSSTANAYWDTDDEDSGGDSDDDNGNWKRRRHPASVFYRAVRGPELQKTGAKDEAVEPKNEHPKEQVTEEVKEDEKKEEQEEPEKDKVEEAEAKEDEKGLEGEKKAYDDDDDEPPSPSPPSPPLASDSPLGSGKGKSSGGSTRDREMEVYDDAELWEQINPEIDTIVMESMEEDDLGDSQQLPESPVESSSPSIATTSVRTSARVRGQGNKGRGRTMARARGRKRK